MPGADGLNAGRSLSADDGRSVRLGDSWGMADACPKWRDKAPQSRLSMALEPWPLWDEDEEQLKTRIAGTEMEAEA